MSVAQNLLAVQYFPSANARCVTYAVGNIGTSAVPVVPAQVRGSLFFSNPDLVGQTNVWVYQALNAAGVAQNLSAGQAGTFLILPGGSLLVSPSGSGAWMAVSNAPGASLSVLEF